MFRRFYQTTGYASSVFMTLPSIGERCCHRRFCSSDAVCATTVHFTIPSSSFQKLYGPPTACLIFDHGEALSEHCQILQLSFGKGPDTFPFCINGNYVLTMIRGGSPHDLSWSSRSNGMSTLNCSGTHYGLSVLISPCGMQKC